MAHTPHLFVPPPWEPDALSLSDGQLHHLRRVLRLDETDAVTYTDGAGLVGRGHLQEGNVVRGEESEQHRPSLLTVAVAPPRSRDRVRYLVEKLAEMGVARLLWVRTRRTEGRPPSPAKAEAWAAGALEQSRGAWAMQIGDASLGDLDGSNLMVADREGGPAVVDREETTLLVGPEGGFDPAEIPEGVRRVSLGPTILRVETAAVVGAALLRAPGR